jgi:transcription factor C subunit 3
VANYRKLVAQEELDKNSAGYADIDLDNVGGFLPVSAECFYNSENALIQYMGAFNDNDKSRARNPKKPPKNPILPDGKTKRGRPRKNPANDEETPLTEPLQKGKRKRRDVGDTHIFPTETIEEPMKKRPRLIEPSVLEEQTRKPT